MSGGGDEDVDRGRGINSQVSWYPPSEPVPGTSNYFRFDTPTPRVSGRLHRPARPPSRCPVGSSEGAHSLLPECLPPTFLPASTGQWTLRYVCGSLVLLGRPDCPLDPSPTRAEWDVPAAGGGPTPLPGPSHLQSRRAHSAPDLPGPSPSTVSTLDSTPCLPPSTGVLR